MLLVAKLTEREIEAFKRLAICKKAVKEVVKECVAEYEDAVRDEQAFWAICKEKYGANFSEEETSRLSLNSATGELNLMTPEEYHKAHGGRAAKSKEFYQAIFEIGM